MKTFVRKNAHIFPTNAEDSGSHKDVKRCDMSNLPEKILVIDDDEMVANQIESLLKTYKVKVEKATKLEKALYTFNNQKFDAVIVEMEFEELPGTVIVQKFRENEFESKKYIPIVISTGLQRDNSQASLMTEIGDITLLSKPVQLAQVISALTKCMSLGSNRASLDNYLSKVIEPLLRQGKMEKAAKVAKTKLFDLGPKGKYEAAVVLEKAGELDEAVATLAGLAKNEPNNMKYINSLARMYMARGDLDKARQYYEQADKIAPDNLSRITEMAGLYLALKEPEKGVEKYTKLLSLNPEKPEMKFEVYQELFDGGFEDHARDLVKQTSTPLELIRHYNNKGVLLSKGAEFQNAINEYNKARQLIPESKQLYRILYNMAIAHINLKSKDDVIKAHKLLTEVLELNPKYDKAREKLAITAKALGKKFDHSA